MLDALGDAFSLAKDLETGARNYAIAGDAAHLEPYEHARAGLRAQLEHVRTLVAEDPVQLDRARRLDTLLHATALNDEIVRLRRTQGFAAVQKALSSGDAADAMNAARRLVADMELHEKGVSGERRVTAMATERSAVLTTLPCCSSPSPVTPKTLRNRRRSGSTIHARAFAVSRETVRRLRRRARPKRTAGHLSSARRPS